MNRPARKNGPAPDRARLREAALAHLARFAATEAGLARLLTRRIDRWMRAAEADAADPEAIAAVAREARAAVPGVIVELRGLGVLDDAGFAAARARRLARGGKSRRATLAHLAAKGIDPALAGAVSVDLASELAVACAYLRRRRMPPFGAGDPARALAALARGGFDREIAARALALDVDEAEALVLGLRRGEAG